MLDFAQVVKQISVFTQRRTLERPQLEAALQEAVKRLRAPGSEWRQTAQKIHDSHTSWLVAGWQEAPDQAHPTPPRPTPCAVLAADGSQIVSDRHDIAPCYLLNIGKIALQYGTGARPILTSQPMLAEPEDDLLEAFPGDQSVIAPRRLNIQRQLAEMAGLTETLAAQPVLPTLALCDGSLILWPLETEEEAFRARALREFCDCLDTAQEKGVSIVGYVSLPESKDVVNSLRVQACPYPKALCSSNCPGSQKPRPEYVAPPCAGTERITDAMLFGECLKPGERSPVFSALTSKIIEHYPAQHRIRFFYLHVGAEVARIEIPKWVADDTDLLDLTHALCYDQAQKGDGYPVALAEAHELAIVRAPEREAFFRLMERDFVTASLPVNVTQKSVSKRARRV